MAHYLFTLWDGGGSLPPELGVVRRVVAAGHRVTVIIDPVAEDEARATGADDIRTWSRAPHHATRLPEGDLLVFGLAILIAGGAFAARRWETRRLLPPEALESAPI